MSMVRRMLLSGMTVLILASAPAHLAAEESRAAAADGPVALEWFSAAWDELASWLAGKVAPGNESNLDSGCIVDPHGGCGG